MFHPFARTVCLMRLAGLSAAFFAGTMLAADAPLQLRLAVEKPEVFEQVAISISGVPPVSNPFDPDVIRLDLEVVSPSGKDICVPGYYRREFARSLEGQNEKLTPTGEGTWQIRWLPTEPGVHKLTASVSLAGKPAGQVEATVTVAAGARHGIARVEPQGKRYFQLSDGTPLFLNGLCACWYGKRGTYDYDDWLDAYQKNGINYIRVWMWCEAFGIEWDHGDLVRSRLDNAWRLDYVLAEAEKRGVYVMLCLDYHGIFEVKPDFWGGNNFWPINPYNATNGGPCLVQNDFFTNADAKKLYQKRLRYLVARYSAYSNILAWEFFNEIDNEYAYLKHEDVVAWHREMGHYLRAIDPFQHLITSSFTGCSERPDLYALTEMDFAQYHSYNENHPAAMVAEKTARFFEKYKKPFFVSEYGTDWKGWKPETDPYFHALHQAIWSGAFSGAAGTSMTWFWEDIHRNNLYNHFSALSVFLKETGVAQGNMTPASFQNVSPNIRVQGMAAPGEALVWILDRASDWPDGARESNPAPVQGVKLTLTNVLNGVWNVQWRHTLTGAVIATNTATAQSGALTLEPPSFQFDIAARLKHQKPQ